MNPDDLLFGVVHTQASSSGPGKAQAGAAGNSKKAKGGGTSKFDGSKGASKPAASTDKRGWPTYEGHGVCFGYNSVEDAKKFKNSAHDKGCKGKDKKGEEKIYAHVCSNWLEGKGYCLGAHKKQM